MNIEFTKHEVEALAGLLDAAVRSMGLRAAKDALQIITKLEKAMEVENGDSNADS